MDLPVLDRLVRALGRLPTVGRRSAERIAVRLVRDRRRGVLSELVDALSLARDQLRCCSRCGSITAAERDPCELCTDPRREDGLLCVVEDPGDVLRMEEAGGFRGRYHVLMGTLSPMRGDGPENLRVQALLERVASEEVTEVVLALNTDVESDATAAYLRQVLRERDVRVSRAAMGIPAGGGISYADPVTLQHAIEERRELR